MPAGVAVYFLTVSVHMNIRDHSGLLTIEPPVSPLRNVLT